ncbi:MAG TPA: HPr-rel-A system PqqD family peptide chaperone [Sphingopyxis sp.]|nr:HPr-rel-A system PqqD family peptide chaperone [Sphingopyxis sp.]HMP44091.1 HPr-rel-A system PqqD family peptide chaperone [Sphingopyxis sp.]HMQ19108.1 HPr-rel-A system PqqD family peptide chaperone [Sphingopyxis sp.]
MAERVYRAAPADALCVEPLGALSAIFDRRSMQTHLVVAPMPEILELLAEGPCDATALAGRLADRFDLDGEGEVAALLAERLTELALMGLVEPA